MGTSPRVSRRRALSILGAAAGLPLAGPFARAAETAGGAPPRGRLAADGRVIHWRGVALGADAEITLHHPDPAAARVIVAAALDEVERLERVFSLHRPESEIRRLNAGGRLEAPSLDMLRLTAEAVRYGRGSGGAFDVTVQPLWRLYADHFAAADADPEGPDAESLARARRLVDYRRLRVGAGGIALARPGMAVTMNGIAQGYITDRVTALLRRRGMTDVLAALGETRALGTRPDGTPWRIGLVDPLSPGRIARVVDLAGRAIASSGGYGLAFERTGRFHHLFDPATGQSAGRLASVSVIAPTATAADALSTALYVAGPDAARAILRAAGGGARAFLTLPDGTVHTVDA